MNGERPWYARGSGAPAEAADRARDLAKTTVGGVFSRDWRNASWWIKGPFLIAVAATIIAAKLGAHFGFEWLKTHMHL